MILNLLIHIRIRITGCCLFISQYAMDLRNNLEYLLYPLLSFQKMFRSVLEEIENMRQRLSLKTKSIGRWYGFITMAKKRFQIMFPCSIAEETSVLDRLQRFREMELKKVCRVFGLSIALMMLISSSIESQQADFLLIIFVAGVNLQFAGF